MADFEQSSIDAAVDVLTKFLSDDRILNIYEEAVGESFTFEERQTRHFETFFGPMMHSFFGRALLRAAEQQFILAAGGADDVTPSSDQVEGDALANAMGG